MNKNILKTLCITFIVFFSVLFIKLDSVKADGDGTGYAQCYYYFEETIAQEELTTYKGYTIGINFYKDGNKKDDLKSWAHVGCGTKKTDSPCTISNYNDIFHQISRYPDYFGALPCFTEGVCETVNWKCPTIWVAKETGNSSMSIYFAEGKCREKNWAAAPELSACKEYSPIASDIQSSGNPPELNTVRDVKQGRASSGDENIDKIIKWGDSEAEKKNYDSAACNIISDDLQDMIDTIIWGISIFAIVALILLTMKDFIKIITLSSDDGFKGAFKNAVIRVVCIVILLILPLIISAIINLINTNNIQKDENGNFKIGDNGIPLCKSTQTENEKNEQNEK